MRKSVAPILLGIMILFQAAYANALTIDIDSLTNTTSNPVEQFFSAGTYDVTMIGIQDGGEFNSWNAWRGNTSGNMGWLNSYMISSDQFATISMGDGTRYKDALSPLENAVATSFTLTEDGIVNFYIGDSIYCDNIGGISLEVTPTPEPGTCVLLGVGLIGLAGIRRKFKK